MIEISFKKKYSFRLGIVWKSLKRTQRYNLANITSISTTIWRINNDFITKKLEYSWRDVNHGNINIANPNLKVRQTKYNCIRFNSI